MQNLNEQRGVIKNIRIEDYFAPAGIYTNWHKEVSDKIAVYSCGYAYDGDDCYSENALAKMVLGQLQIRSTEGWPDFFKHLNGNWGLVVLKGTVLYAVVDRIRSYPLLYSEVTGNIRISDSIKRMCIRPSRWCSEAVEDFLWAGYPTGTMTLVDGVNQIPAGIYLQYDVATGQKSLNEYFGFFPNNNNDNEGDGKQFETQLGKLLSEAIQRIRKVPHGKIIVPLSGGMDSRVIVALLKKHGFKDVLCFTYGYRGNAESEASRQVAEALGYEWHFVEYTPETWASCTFSQELKDFLIFGSDGCGRPVYSSWYAIKTLMESGKIPKDSTFLPGHTGILVSNILPERILNEGQVVSMQSIIEHIIWVHLCYWMGTPPLTIRQRFIEQFRFQMGNMPLCREEANRLYGQWYWRERQSKFIVNSNRIYEYFGCRWLTPLWDVPLIDFYLTAPGHLRRKKHLFLQTAIQSIFIDELSVLANIPLAVRGNLSPRQVLEHEPIESSWKESLFRLYNKFRWKVSGGRIVNSTRHDLLWEHSYADNHNPRRQTVRQVFSKNGMGDVFDFPECKSILPFADTPVAYVHPFGLTSLSGIAQIQSLMKNEDS